MKKDLTASEICKRLFQGTGEINYYMLYRAIDSARENQHIDVNDLTR